MKLAVYTIKSEDEKSKIRDELHIVSAYYMKNTDAEVGIAIIQNWSGSKDHQNMPGICKLFIFKMNEILNWKKNAN